MKSIKLTITYHRTSLLRKPWPHKEIETRKESAKEKREAVETWLDKHRNLD